MLWATSINKMSNQLFSLSVNTQDWSNIKFSGAFPDVSSAAFATIGNKIIIIGGFPKIKSDN